jgi:antitoxin (DNA-binding transcriptional repressor) of toxin-antitoxin stability system
MTIHVSIKDAKNRLSELVRAVEEGERVVVTRRGEPVAEMGPPKPRRAGLDFEALRRWKLERGVASVAGPMSPDFDDELPEDFLSTPLR